MKNLKETFLRLAKDSVIVSFGGLMWAAGFAALTYSTEGKGFEPMIPAGIFVGGVFAALGFISFILYKLWR